MSDDLKYYELLGVAPGVSAQELKTAHRDLAKVWHPDRFAHDPRLQQKAQEKLKEINEAYDLLASAKTGRRKPAAAASANPHSPTPTNSARPVKWTLILLPALVFTLLGFAAYRTLIPANKPSAQSSRQTAEQPQTSLDEGAPQSDTINKPRAIDSPRGKRREDGFPVETNPGATSISAQQTKEIRPLPTSTVTIDPASGLLAKAGCPTKSRMTYPSGSEPSQFCNIQHRSAAPEQADEARPKESRLKSFARRLGAPAKLLGGKEGNARNP